MKKHSQIYVDMDTGQWIVGESNIITSITSMVATQSTPSTTWNIPHNKGTNKVIVQVKINNENVIPDEVKIVDDDNIIVTFVNETTGTVNLLFF